MQQGVEDKNLEGGKSCKKQSIQNDSEEPIEICIYEVLR
jgi:hypothetical protein